MKLKTQVILSVIIIIILTFAFIYVNVYKELSTKTANSTEGFCNAPADCGNLIHVECVGNWVCESHRCGYICGTAQSTQTAGGLSASTVECINDSDCKLGVCEDNSTYSKYNCLNNKCTEINYFADPCKV